MKPQNFKFLFFFLLGLFSTSCLLAHEIRGRILSDTGDPLQGVVIYHPASGDYSTTDISGRFLLPSVDVGQVLSISHLGFESMQLTIDKDHIEGEFSIVLAEAPLNLEQVVLTPTVNPMESMAMIDFQQVPVRSAQDLLNRVPGLFTGQHAGGGKAEQIFLRGFDVDHGTDVAIHVDGMPVNQVSHAHGQGYADAHFIIPETLRSIDYGKGPYFADKGNFATAGFVEMQTLDALESNLVRTEGGMFGSFRALAMFDLLSTPTENAYIATSYSVTDGYFESSQDFSRLNIFAKYRWQGSGGAENKLALSHFSSEWLASGQIPVRAVASGAISRFGAIDDTEGGTTSRTDLRFNSSKILSPSSQLKFNAFVSRYDFELFSNFTFFLDDPEFGDQIRQSEGRWTTGGEARYQKFIALPDPGKQLRYALGSGARVDFVNDVELSRTINRNTLKERLAFGDVREANPYVFGEAVYHTGPWTFTSGLRAEAIYFDYTDQIPGSDNGGSTSRWLVNPKVGVDYNPNPGFKLFFKAGSGFHSNDTRVAITRPVSEVIPRALGTDLGGQFKLGKGLLVSGSFWTLFLEQEFIYVGDEGVVEPGGRTRRYGIDLGVRYQPMKKLYLFSDVTIANARSVDAPEASAFIPLAPDFTLTSGLRFSDLGKFSGGSRLRYLGDRPATEDGRIMAEDFTVVDLNLDYDLGAFTLGLIVENLFDTEWKETQFATESRLQGESSPVEELHFTPGTPFAVRARLTARF